MNLRTDLWAYALMRRVTLAGGAATVARKGDLTGGSVLVKTYDPKTRTSRLYARAMRGDGESVWMRPISDESDEAIEAYVIRATRIDPDVWVIELETPDAASFFTEPVEER